MDKIRLVLREPENVIDEVIFNPNDTRGVLVDNSFKLEIIGLNAYSRLACSLTTTDNLKVRTFLDTGHLLYLIRCGTISHNVTKKNVKIECVNHERLIKYIR